MDAEIVELASSAANTVVRLVATDGWKRVTSAVGGLWRRVHPDRAATVEAELVETRTTLLSAQQAGDEQAQVAAVAEWVGRLRRLMAVDQTVVDAVRSLVADLDTEPSSTGDSRAERIELRARASGRSRLYQAGRDLQIGDT